MKLKEIQKGEAGRFLTRYDLHYRMGDGHEKVYEMVSRAPLATESDVAGTAADGVVILVLNREHTRVLLNREFRPAVNGVVYNFPAGLLERGEIVEDAAARELWEETGLHITRQLAVWGRSYGSVGISNESAVVCVCEADDTEPFGGNYDPAEEIAPMWLSRTEAQAVVQSGAVTARVQMFLALWGRQVEL